MSHHEIFRTIAEELEAGRPVVQATIVQTRGSTPRKEGSVMLVKADGSLVGTVGGGCGEAGVIQKARLSLMDGKFREEHADLTEDVDPESEAVCGGVFRVFIEPWQPTAESLSLVRELDRLSTGEQGVLVHQIIQAPDEAQLGRRILQRLDGTHVHPAVEAAPRLKLPDPPRKKPHQVRRSDDVEFYTERWDPSPALIIVGAGHIAAPLEQVGRLLGFRTVVVDDRFKFANRERFPEADRVVCGPIVEVMRQIELHPQTYLVLVTRGHQLDMDALRVVIERNAPVPYVGMIGSSRRVRAVFQLLAEEGLPRERFTNVHSPVGLNIGAETPAEIAVAIGAEIVSVARGAGDNTRPLARINETHLALRPLPGKKQRQAARAVPAEPGAAADA